MSLSMMNKLPIASVLLWDAYCDDDLEPMPVYEPVNRSVLAQSCFSIAACSHKCISHMSDISTTGKWSQNY